MLADLCVYVNYEKGDTIVVEGSVGTHFYVIKVRETLLFSV